ALNHALESIAGLNSEIQRQTLLGGAPESLMDRRQTLVDQIARLVPIREFAREDGRIMLMAEDGSILVDRVAARFAFARTPDPSAQERIDNGGVSPVLLNGRDVSPTSALFASGQLGAALRIRDTVSLEMQDGIDRIAADLIARFAAPEIDASLGA
ncbi:FlgK family flagellar hook-associated protein, partial [Acinetobacter nosocomialis]|uniref:FlgK family flagellar hook-associated protein n=1 Tax=Acinetobacter nosocomialis TaxID=106654 RepID=UPI001C06CEC0